MQTVNNLLDDAALTPDARRARSERMHALRAQMKLRDATGDHAGVLALGQEALALYGDALPARPASRVLAARVIESLLRARHPLTVLDLIDLPRSTDATALERADLYECILPAAAVLDLDLHAHLSAALLELTLKTGFSPAAAYGFAAASVVVAQTPMGDELSRLAVLCADRHGGPADQVRARMLRVLVVAHWHVPLRESVSEARLAIQHGHEAADRHFTTWAMVASLQALSSMGGPLEGLLAHCNSVIETLRLNAPQLVAFAQIARAFALRLRDGCEPRDFFDDREVRATLREAKFVPAWVTFLTRKLMLDHLEGRTGECDADLEDLERIVPLAPNFSVLFDFHVVAALVKLAKLRARPGRPDSAMLRAEVERHFEVLKGWDASPSGNVRHSVHLVRGLLAAHDGAADIAQRELDRAVVVAVEGGFFQYAAIASEAASALAQERGHRVLVDTYARDAHRCFKTWGALWHARRLADAHGIIDVETR